MRFGCSCGAVVKALVAVVALLWADPLALLLHACAATPCYLLFDSTAVILRTVCFPSVVALLTSPITFRRIHLSCQFLCHSRALLRSAAGRGGMPEVQVPPHVILHHADAQCGRGPNSVLHVPALLVQVLHKHVTSSLLAEARSASVPTYCTIPMSLLCLRWQPVSAKT